MKYNYFTIGLLSSALFFSACSNHKQTDTQATDSTAIAATTESTTDIPITERIANLGLTADSDWRGIKLGDEFANVKGLEKGEPFESDSDHIGYTIELKNLETADILYYQTDKKVSAIDVDLFLNTRQSVSDYQKDLDSYFTARYGTPKPGDGGTVWSGWKRGAVTLKDVSKGKDFGLKIKIASTSNSATASAK
ncbi:hypothetical protein EXU85_13135 [Spirosoma sp. KCTC 42546]|uniref:hypothetical protein n=1 Tax=Spirosoma sp. KCTC 42546 TaxID=2520506 RepID=UPI00115AF7FB|nr:hypothetical protein [Spirosoma sp. KCTC 42546]QDK79495.1 hypothetical protein EXU85_13135 [Spirosoma sp. KCTC 42546]